jgi:uncharacterized protein YndB with AHSA1/START domain
MLPVANPVPDTLVVEQFVRAAPAEVFADLTTPDRMLKWWGDPAQWWLTSAEVEPRSGGRWWLHWESAAGRKGEMGGRFRTVDPGKSFVLAFIGSRDKDRTDEVLFQLRPGSGGTHVILRHSGLAGRPERLADYEKGWRLVLSWLAWKYSGE